MAVTERGLRVDFPSPAVRILRLSRPERLNALSWELADALGDAVEDLAHDPDCRAAILTGEGRGFCSGLDLQMSEDPVGSDGSMVTFMNRQERLAALVSSIRELPIPVIAAVNGPAAGGGLALALACDLRVCAESARFNAAFIRIGLSACDMGVSYALPRLIGLGAASELLLTGRHVGAHEAFTLGMVNRVVPDEELLDAALALAEEIARNSPFAVRMTKEVLAANVDSPSLAAALALENRTQAVASRTSDHAEALDAFMEKREPRFCGV